MFFYARNGKFLFLRTNSLIWEDEKRESKKHVFYFFVKYATFFFRFVLFFFLQSAAVRYFCTD